MIDIHNHILYGVDDGPKDIDLSLRMLKDAAAQGVTAMILTPHYRKGMFSYDKERIAQNYELLTIEARKAGIPIDLYLGCELHRSERLLDQLRTHRVSTMAGTDYVLTEFAYEDDYDTVYDTVSVLRDCGYLPIIAHVERIGCLRKKPALCEELQEMGVRIQCNAQAVLGREGFLVKRFTQTLLKHHWVDMIASDAHNMDNRPITLGDARTYLEARFGAACAAELLETNPRQILDRIPGNI